MKTETGPLILAIGRSLVISEAVLGYGGARGGQKLNRRGVKSGKTVSIAICLRS